MLNREQILAQSLRYKIETVETPLGPICIRPMSSRTRGEIIALLRTSTTEDGTDLPELVPRVALACMCNSDGTLMFTDLDEVGDLPADVLDDVTKAALRISGLGAQAVDEAKND